MSFEEKLSQELHEQAKGLEVPSELDTRIRNAAYIHLKESSIPAISTAFKHKFAYAAVASVVLFSGVFSTGFFSPAMADVLKKVPLLGSVFESSEQSDAGLEAASEAGFAMPINQVVTDQGVKVTLTEMINDGLRLSFAATFEFPEGVEVPEHNAVTGFTYTRPGYGELRGAREGYDWRWNHVEGNKYSGIFEITNIDLPEEFNMKMKFTEIGTVQGNWEFDVPIKRTGDLMATREFEVNQQQSYNNNADVLLTAVHLGPSATQVDFSMKGPELAKWLTGTHGEVRLYDPPQVVIYTDKGKMLDHINVRIYYHGENDISVEAISAPVRQGTEYLVVQLKEWRERYNPFVDEGKTVLEYKVNIPKQVVQ